MKKLAIWRKKWNLWRKNEIYKKKWN